MLQYIFTYAWILFLSGLFNTANYYWLIVSTGSLFIDVKGDFF